MNRRSFFAATAAIFALCSITSFAAPDAAKQAEIRKAAQASLEKFYKAQPRIQGEVKAAPGYAVFTTYGVSFLLGGSGGTGLAHDAQSGKETFMNMGQASAGLQASIGQRDLLIVFKTRKGLEQFVTNGWEFGGGGAMAAGAGGHTAGGGSGEQTVADALTYTLTKNGLDVGGALAGTKFWKDKELN